MFISDGDEFNFWDLNRRIKLYMSSAQTIDDGRSLCNCEHRHCHRIHGWQSSRSKPPSTASSHQSDEGCPTFFFSATITSMRSVWVFFALGHCRLAFSFSESTRNEKTYTWNRGKKTLISIYVRGDFYICKGAGITPKRV